MKAHIGAEGLARAMSNPVWYTPVSTAANVSDISQATNQI
jgi:hypothetical protein